MRRTIGSMAMLLVLSLLSTAWGWAVPAQQEANLLYNGGFEGTYVAVPGHDNMNVAAGWTAWWVQGTPEENARGLLLQPEFKAAFLSDWGTSQGSRVHSGAQAQQYFHSFGAFTGGVYQRVTVPRNARLRLSVWGQAWSCLHYDNCHSSSRVWSDDPSPMFMRVGIDPTGGADPFSSRIVWSGYANPYDAYQLFTVDAAALGTAVTVFLYAAPIYPNDDNDVYWDDASLVVLGPPSPTPRPTRTPGPSPTPRPSRTPTPSPAPPTPTETRRPSHTPTPTATDTPVPTATPLPPTETPAPARGTICISAFSDPDRNGSREPGEVAQSGLSVSLLDSTQALVSTYRMEAEASHCFELAPGAYTVLADLPAGLSATTPLTRQITLDSGQDVAVEFGSTALPPPAAAPGVAAYGTVAGAIVVGLIILAGLIFVVIRLRRSDD